MIGCPVLASTTWPLTAPFLGFGGGAGSDVYESWFDQHIASALSKTDALGLAGMLKAGIGVKEEQAESGKEGSVQR